MYAILLQSGMLIKIVINYNFGSLYIIKLTFYLVSKGAEMTLFLIKKVAETLGLQNICSEIQRFRHIYLSYTPHEVGQNYVQLHPTKTPIFKEKH